MIVVRKVNVCACVCEYIYKDNINNRQEENILCQCVSFLEEPFQGKSRNFI